MAQHTSEEWDHGTTRAMPKKARPYIVSHPEMRSIVEEIENGISTRARLRGEEIEQKEIASAIHLDQGEVSRKLAGQTRWNLHELMALARFLAAPPGWPLIPWDTAAKSLVEDQKARR